MRHIKSPRLKRWMEIFAEASRYCKTHRRPGEKHYECVRRVLAEKKKEYRE